MEPAPKSGRHYFEAVGLVTLLCLALLVFRAVTTKTLRYWFIPENLVLAWAGLMFSYLLVRGLKKWRWLSWQNLSLTLLWLFFLPNTWYVLTDFIHVYPTGEISELFDIILIGTLTTVGFALGFTSLYLVHRELIRKVGLWRSFLLIEAVILISSYAIYLGRVLRWNSWDVIANPGGVIVNVSDRVLDPLGHPHVFLLGGLFFVLISVLYLAMWRGLQALPKIAP